MNKSFDRTSTSPPEFIRAVIMVTVSYELKHQTSLSLYIGVQNTRLKLY